MPKATQLKCPEWGSSPGPCHQVQAHASQVQTQQGKLSQIDQLWFLCWSGPFPYAVHADLTVFSRRNRNNVPGWLLSLLAIFLQGQVTLTTNPNAHFLYIPEYMKYKAKKK